MSFVSYMFNCTCLVDNGKCEFLEIKHGCLVRVALGDYEISFEIL